MDDSWSSKDSGNRRGNRHARYGIDVPVGRVYHLQRRAYVHAAISSEMAIRLEKAGWSNAEFWLRRQTTWDLVQARKDEDRINVERYQPQPSGVK